MTEAKIRTVTIIDEVSHWSTVCRDQLRSFDIDATIQEPIIDLLTKESVKSRIFVVPIHSMDSDRFDLVKLIGESEGTSLVLAGRQAADMAMQCMTLPNAYCVGIKSLNFIPLVNAINRINARRI